MLSSVVKERLGSGSTPHMLPAVRLSGRAPAAESRRVKKLNRIELQFQMQLFEVDTHYFVKSLVHQCKADPSLAEYVWFALFPVVLGYKDTDDKLWDRMFKNPEFPSVAEKALAMMPDLSTDYEKSFVRGPNFSNFCVLEYEKRLFQTENPEYRNVEQVWSCYTDTNADDLKYGLFHHYFPRNSVPLAYENFGLFKEAKKGYEEALLSLPSQGFSNDQKSESHAGFKRCQLKLMRWESMTKGKFFSCHLAFQPQEFETSCDCLQIEEGTDSIAAFRLMYFLLCPWNVRRDRERPQSHISKTLDDTRRFITFKLKKIPSVITPECIHQLKRAARVSEFEKSHIILKSFFDTEASHERDAIFLREFSERSSLDDLELWDEAHGARLRSTSVFLTGNGSETSTESVTALDLYNDYFMRLASGTLERGDLDSCFEYLKNVRDPLSQELLESRTDLLLNTINIIDSPGERYEYLRLAFDHFQEYDDSTRDLQQAKCYAYMGLLKSYPGSGSHEHTFWAAFKLFKNKTEDLFKLSLQLKKPSHIFSKQHEWYGNFLERTIIETQTRRREMSIAKDAIRQLLYACKYTNKSETQVPIAKVLGLLIHDEDEELQDVLLQQSQHLPPDVWLPLLPQLLRDCCSRPSSILHPLLQRIGSTYPQELFFALEELRSGIEKYPKSFSKELVNTIRRLRKKNVRLFCTLEKIGEELLSLKKTFGDDTVERLYSIRVTVCEVAYECIVRCSAEPESMELQSSLEYTLSRLLQAEIKNILQIFNPIITASSSSTEDIDPMKSSLRTIVEQFEKLSNAIKRRANYHVWLMMRKFLMLLTNLIKEIEGSKKVQTKSLYNHCKYLSTFHLYETKVGMFRNLVPPVTVLPGDRVKITKFLPKVEVILKHSTYTCRVYILGSNGQEYSYLVSPVSCKSPSEDRVFQFFSFLNHILAKENLYPRFSIPSVIPFPGMCLVEDDSILHSYFNIYSSCRLKCDQNPLAVHYRLFEYYKTFENRNLQPLRDERIRCKIFEEVQRLVPKTILKDWVKRNCRNSVDYIMFRRKFASEISLLVFAKYCFHLSLLAPDNLMINKRSGVLSSFGLKFNPHSKISDSQKIISGSGNCTWPPLQLTPNMLAFLNSTGVHGSLVLTMAAIARCFNKNMDEIGTMLNLLIYRDLEEARIIVISDMSRSEFDEKIFKESRHHIDDIAMRIKRCAGFGTYNELHDLVSDSFLIKNMSLANPASYPWL